MLRSQINDLVEQMGLKPENVINIEIRPKHIVLWTLVRNSDGTVQLGDIGPRLGEVYRSIEDDVSRSAGGTSTGDRCT